MIRRGITLLEVLFSVGVVAIGLLGVLSVIPVALNQLGKGQVADGASRAGLNAIREFEATGMGRAEVWLRYASMFPIPAGSGPRSRFVQVTYKVGTDTFWGNNTGNPPGDDDGDGTSNEVDEAGWPGSDDRIGEYPLPAVSFALDPRFLSDPVNWTTAGSGFPFAQPSNTTLPRMMRVTLGTPGSPLSYVQSEKLFVIDDDLLFDIPKEVEDPPKQFFVWTPGPDGEWGAASVDDDGVKGVDDIGERGWPGTDDVAAAREFEGAYSWMATIVPKRDQLGANNDRYLLSIVVFHRRVVPDLTNSIALGSERAAFIPDTDFYSLGFSGGDVTLHAYPAAVGGAGPADLEVKSGDWVCLAGLLSRATTSLPYFRWYRVAAADEVLEEPPGSGLWQRDITLEGPDWPLASLIAHPTAPPMPPRRDDTRVYLVSDVVAVYERTLIIEKD